MLCHWSENSPNWRLAGKGFPQYLTMGRFSRISRKDFQVKYWVLDDQGLIRKIVLIEKVFLNISPENLTQGRFPRFSQEGSSDRWINRDQPSGRQLFFSKSTSLASREYPGTTRRWPWPRQPFLADHNFIFSEKHKICKCQQSCGRSHPATFLMQFL